MKAGGTEGDNRFVGVETLATAGVFMPGRSIVTQGRYSSGCSLMVHHSARNSFGLANLNSLTRSFITGINVNSSVRFDLFASVESSPD